MNRIDGHNETAPLGFDAEGWPMPEVRAMMIDNFSRSWTRHWIAVAIIFVITVFLVMFSVFLVTPRWEGQSLAMINEQALPNLAISNASSTDTGRPDASTTVGNLIEIAKSRPFLTEVVRDLKLDQYFQDKASSPGPRDRIKQTIMNVVTLRFLRSGGQPDWESRAVEELQSKWLASTPMERTSMVPILIYGDNPVKTMEVGDAILDHLKVFMDRLYRQNIEGLLPALRTETESLETQIANDEQQITDLLAGIGYADPKSYADLVMSGLADLQQQKATIDLEIRSAQATELRLQEELKLIPEFAKVMSETSSEKPMLRMSEQLGMQVANKQAERQGMLQNLPANSPKITSLDAQIQALMDAQEQAKQTEAQQVAGERITDTLDPRHRQTFGQWLEAAAKVASLEARQLGLGAAMETLNSSQREAITAAQQLERFERQKTLHVSQYNARYSKLIEFETMLEQPTLFNVMQKVAPTSVKSTKKPDNPNMLLAAIIAVVLGVFTALLLPIGFDYINQTLMSSRQASAIPGVRVIAAVPKSSSRKMYTPASL
ncbi:MAG: hypothetical protein D8M59_01300 [Planctomycetes bacterium]|nr:hypothetical protein [Planctomycetota bacterium]NOG54645.1 hypothetical protein [Planctomycetota bacterium]